jgi:hypothetical protein
MANSRAIGGHDHMDHPIKSSDDGVRRKKYGNLPL